MSNEHLEAFQMEIQLLKEQLKHEQQMIQEAMSLLNKAGVPTNGEEGQGKRQELSLPQRIMRLLRGEKKRLIK